MLFNTWTFAVFFALVTILYYRVAKKSQNLLLLIASNIFYGAWDPRFLALLWFSIGIDYWVGIALGKTENQKQRTALIRISVIGQLAILAVFKYYNFFIQSLSELLQMVQVPFSPPLLEIVLPVGISFYTFQTLNYTLDVYWRKLEPMHDAIEFALFVSYFPHLVAGPILRARDVLPQLDVRRHPDKTMILSGLWLCLWGLVKKCVIADNLAPIVDEAFMKPVPSTGGEAWLAVLAFTFQIYGDFSGYTDIARGVSKLLGIELKLNFNLPYLASSPSDFWRRWHISLSSWLRDYLYIPLGGNRGSEWLTYRNLILTMVIGGLWHGAAWNFVVWGAYHGAILAVHRWFTKTWPLQLKAPWGHWLAIVVMFQFTCIGWLLFRAQSLVQIGTFLEKMLFDISFDSSSPRQLFHLLVAWSVLTPVEAWVKNQDDPRTAWGWNHGLGPLVVSVLILLLIVLTPPGSRQFIYFQF